MSEDVLYRGELENGDVVTVYKNGTINYNFVFARHKIDKYPFKTIHSFNLRKESISALSLDIEKSIKDFDLEEVA